MEATEVRAKLREGFVIAYKEGKPVLIGRSVGRADFDRQNYDHWSVIYALKSAYELINGQIDNTKLQMDLFGEQKDKEEYEQLLKQKKLMEDAGRAEVKGELERIIAER